MRLIELDLLRFVAVLLVLGRHMVKCSPDESPWAARFSYLWVQGGWIGVDMFFVLSGFLVSGLLFRELHKRQSVDLPRFLVRRAFKIYPPFWALIGVTVCMGALGFPSSLGKSVWAELLFVQNYFHGLWFHTWSLAVEEHFYLLLAGMVALMIRYRRPSEDPLSRVPGIFACIAFICYGLRVVTNVLYPNPDEAHIFATHLRVDSLMFGVLLAYSWHGNGLVRSPWVRTRARWLLALGCVLLLPAFIFPLETTGWIPVLGVVVFYLGSGALLIGLLHVGVPDIWTCRMAARLGTYSYSIYLWHMPVHVWVVPNVMKMLPAPYQYSWFVYLSVYLIGSFSLGIVLCKLIETPALLLRDKWFPSRAEAAGLRATPRSQSVPNFQVADRSNPLMTPPTG